MGHRSSLDVIVISGDRDEIASAVRRAYPLRGTCYTTTVPGSEACVTRRSGRSATRACISSSFRVASPLYRRAFASWGPWQGLSGGEIIRLKTHYRLQLAEQNFVALHHRCHSRHAWAATCSQHVVRPVDRLGRLLIRRRKSRRNMWQLISNIHDRQQVEIASSQAGKAAMTDKLGFFFDRD